MSNPYSISIIIPVYNEIDLLERAIHKIDTFILAYFQEYEIIIIESGSTDGSDDVCKQLDKQLSTVKVIYEGRRNGFGSALKLGYKVATKDLVWFVTVDFPFLLETILRAVPLFSHVDCVLSYRSKDSRKEVFRKLQSFVYNRLVKVLLGLKVKHPNSAFKVFKREVIQSLPLVSKGWFIDAETLYWIHKKNVSYVEIPVELLERESGTSSVTAFTSLSLLKELIYFYRMRKTLVNSS